MMRQLANYGSLVLAHGKSLQHKLVKGSNPAVRVPAVTSDRPLSWYEKLFYKLYTTGKAYCQSCTLVFESSIFPRIYVGSERVAAAELTYTELGIDCVLNCAFGVPSFYSEHVDFYQHFDMIDDAGGYVDFVHDTNFRSKLYKFIQQLYDDALTRQKQHLKPRKLLIHCVFGRSRSVALTILVLYLWYQFSNTPKTIADIYQELYKRRPVIEINQRFYAGLNEFDREFQSNLTFRNAWLSVFNPIPNTQLDQSVEET